MNRKNINFEGRIIPYIESESESKNMLIFFHGLDGTASSVKPFVRNLNNVKVVAIEQRGHKNSPMKSSRSVKKHIDDYKTAINFFKAQGYKIWIVGESMGASYVSILSAMELDIEGIYALSIPNKLVNIMTSNWWTQFKVQFWTVIGFFSNINYKYEADINYGALSSNKLMIRLSNLDNKGKIRQTRETLSTWKANKVAWRVIKGKDSIKPFFYFHGESDVLCDINKIEKSFSKNRTNRKIIKVPEGYHILSWEKNAKMIFEKIQDDINKSN